VSPDLQQFVILAPIGFLVGAYGTLVGAGGGSILVPVLLLLNPTDDPATITAISLAVVFFNAYSGTLSYVRMGRVDFRAGTIFGIAGIPGAILGTFLVHEIPRAWFDPAFGVLLLGIGSYLVANPLGSRRPGGEGGAGLTEPQMLAGSIGSAYIGVLSSLLGIGGGIIHVPFLIRGLGMSPHVATATSHFVLTIVALVATLTHVWLGAFEHGVTETAYLSIGVMMGAPLGAAASAKLHGSLIMRILASALCLVGLRMLWRSV
jgi:uncharacterized membrane protein YfcA